MPPPAAGSNGRAITIGQNARMDAPVFAAADSRWRLSVAPMLDWTDRHCRAFHRLLTVRTRLYTEMVTTGALLHGDVARHLAFDAAQHPLALQLGGSEAADLAACARLARQWGYDEVNLNCGCPSERVQRGAFGACLMAEPMLVADCVKAMNDAAGGLPVTVKHRIGIDAQESYEFVRDFVGTVAEAGCAVFVVHSRNAWLKGLSPKENRDVPPLRYEFAYRLKRDFAALTIVLNGGVAGDAAITEHLLHVDGVMLGRHAYHEPWSMAAWDGAFFDTMGPAASREEVEARWVAYLEALHARGTPWPHAMRHALGLWNGTPGARRWRQVWSDHHMRSEPPVQVARRATAARLSAANLAGRG
jgi:tRNA-dihydrouridine synthase A